MEVTITGRHLEITDAIRDYVEAKMGRLPRFFNRLRSIDVTVEKVEKGLAVEARAQADRHEPFVAKVQGPDLYGCIDAASDKLERQLTDHKERIRNRKHNVG